MKKITTILIIMLTITFVSCEDWLDVSPKVEIKEKDLFEEESGYFDALFGVYNKLNSQALYGDKLTMSFMDILAQNYSIYQGHPFYEMTQFDYEHTRVKPIIEDIWAGMYNAIANTNNILINLETSSDKIFSGDNKNIIKGEALALRAFCHFDLIRMFGSSVAMGKEDNYIPYVKNLDVKNTPAESTTAILEKVITDLKQAEQLLANDPITKDSTEEDIYLASRETHLNIYAVKALLARVYLYKGDKKEALEYALQVMDKFSLTQNLVGVPNDRIFSYEIIFCLFDNNRSKTAESYFSNMIASQALKMLNYYLEKVYEKNDGGSTDVRYTKLFKTDGTYSLQEKFLHKDNDMASSRSKMPIIRLSEMYYIAAEATTELEDAVDYINAVRKARGLEETSFDSLEEIQPYLVKEYRKEFYSEGQLFYLYKRLNMEAIPSCTLNISEKLEEVYIFPKPDQEIEFGAN